MSRLWQHRAARHALFWLATVALSFAAQLPAHWLGGAPLYVGGLGQGKPAGARFNLPL